MTVLPSPIPSPLDLSPWDLPRWVDEAVTWVIGFSWPEADEKQSWDVADRWYISAGRRADPAPGPASGASASLPRFPAATGPAVPESSSTGPAAPGDRVAGAAMASAPVVSLIELSHAIGQVIEECGRDIEAAKLEAWTELVTFLIELVGMAVAVALTLGAAAPAADALIAATRFSIQQTFRRLDNHLSRKTLPAEGQLTGP